MHFYLIFILTPLYIIMPSQCVLAVFKLFEFSNLFSLFFLYFSHLLAPSRVKFCELCKSCSSNKFVASSLLKLLDFCSLYLLLFISVFCLPTSINNLILFVICLFMMQAEFLAFRCLNFNQQKQ